MCGICGLADFDGKKIEESRLETMTAALRHRGPDDSGLYFNPSANSARTAFGFRRLSILDVEGGHQPMKHNHLVLVFNGEIYNFPELKRECESAGRKFRTRSDTEVILQLFERDGESALEKLNGMFAFALWDEHKEELLLARDRLGIKPLYYFRKGNRYGFASEMKSLYLSGEIPLDFDLKAISDYFTYRFVPGPHTVLKNVKKVLPGHAIKISRGAAKDLCYWPTSKNGKREYGEQDPEKTLLTLLDESVKSQMISDVPLGAFLSGGVDSSLMSALMVRHSPKKVQTFSIGFEEGTGVDESAHARKVARHIGSDHHELILGEKDLLKSERVFSTMNEPVADPTILPTAILSEFARREVKVVLTGEGGDELFAGYNRYKSILYSSWIKNLPGRVQPLAGKIFHRSGKGACFGAIPNVDAGNWFDLNRDFSQERLSTIFRDSRIPQESYLNAQNPRNVLADPLNQVLGLERETAMVDRLLMKVDMAAMSHSLEARPPYLDHKVVEFSDSLSSEHKIRFFKGKYILRLTAQRFLPKDICWRRKHGFIIPLGKMVNVGSREWLTSTLEHPTLESTGLFSKNAIQKSIENIYNKQVMEEISFLWPLIVLSSWLRSLKAP